MIAECLRTDCNVQGELKKKVQIPNTKNLLHEGHNQKIKTKQAVIATELNNNTGRGCEKDVSVDGGTILKLMHGVR
jgi:hypothetical protein